MNCEEMGNLLSAYLDGELPADEMKEVSAHLKACGRCQQDMRELMRVNSFLANYADEPLPASLEAKLAAIGHKRRWLHWVRDLSLAASVAAALFFGVIISGEVTSKTATQQIASFGGESLYTLYEEAGR